MHRSAILRKISRKHSVTCDAVDESKIRKDYAKAMTLAHKPVWGEKTKPAGSHIQPSGRPLSDWPEPEP